ncbi:hypothetical protein NQD34_007585, partial [Periophthalmus magnuspinnatus]
RDFSNVGALSLTSITLTTRLVVPVRGGLPPSMAVNTSLRVGCFSLSNGFCNTNSAETSCSPPLCTSSEKNSFGLS